MSPTADLSSELAASLVTIKKHFPLLTIYNGLPTEGDMSIAKSSGAHTTYFAVVPSRRPSVMSDIQKSGYHVPSYTLSLATHTEAPSEEDQFVTLE